MLRNFVRIASTLVLAGCAGAQEPARDTADSTASSEETSHTEAHPSAGADADAAESSPAADTTATVVDHAPGGPECNELAKTCHDTGHGDDELGKCHQIGHAGDASVCKKELARCVDLCTKASAKQPKRHHAH